MSTPHKYPRTGVQGIFFARYVPFLSPTLTTPRLIRFHALLHQDSHSQVVLSTLLVLRLLPYTNNSPLLSLCLPPCVLRVLSKFHRVFQSNRLGRQARTIDTGEVSEVFATVCSGASTTDRRRLDVLAIVFLHQRRALATGSSLLRASDQDKVRAWTSHIFISPSPSQPEPPSSQPASS